MEGSNSKNFLKSTTSNDIIALLPGSVDKIHRLRNENTLDYSSNISIHNHFQCLINLDFVDSDEAEHFIFRNALQNR